MRAAAALLCALALAACVSGITQRDGGVATYDALRQAQQACESKGGTFKLKRNGDAQYLDDYACERKK